MLTFEASTQYRDWEGTAAADGQISSLHEWLKEKGLIEPDEFLLAATLSVLEHHLSTPYIRAFVFEKGKNYESVKDALATTKGPIPVREVSVELTTEQFIGLFKRLNVMLTWHGLELTGREYHIVNE